MAEIEDLINNVANQDFSKAGPTFAEIMSSKISDAMEQEKIAVAGQMFNGEEPEDDEEQLEFDLDDITDEELDDAVEDLDDDEEDYDEDEE